MKRVLPAILGGILLVGALQAARSPRPSRKPSARHGRRETRSGRGSAIGRDVGLWLVAALAVAAHDPLTSTGKPRWLVTCSCGWGRACSSEWAAQSVSKLHPQLVPMDVAHEARIPTSD